MADGQVLSSFVNCSQINPFDWDLVEMLVIKKRSALSMMVSGSSGCFFRNLEDIYKMCYLSIWQVVVEWWQIQEIYEL